MSYFKIYIFLLLNVLVSNGICKNKEMHDYRNYQDTVDIFKRYKTPLSISKSNGFYEKLELLKNGRFNYLIKVGLIKKNFNGKWEIKNETLQLQDDDTTKIIKITEKFIGSIPKNTKRFFIANTNGEEMGYNLIVKSCNGKYLKINDSNTNLDLKVQCMEYFQVSSVISFDNYFPLKHSNYFEIRINSNKVYLKNAWRITGTKLYSVLNRNSKDYYLEEF